MEEQQIQDLVHRATTDVALRLELGSDPLGMMIREGLSPRVVQIILRLLPHFALDQPMVPAEWWHA